MYAETFGIQNPSAEVELCAQWVQWAQTALLAGATSNETEVRWNLTQFWNEKAAAYYAEDETGRQNLEKLDTWAHGLWNALESGKVYSASPSYWDFYKSFFAGGTPARPEALAAASAAAAASVGEKAAAERAGGTFGTGFAQQAQNQLNNLPALAADASRLWKQPGAIQSIPTWAWIAAAAGLYLMVRR